MYRRVHLDIEGLACLHQSLLDDFFAQHGIKKVQYQEELLYNAIQVIENGVRSLWT